MKWKRRRGRNREEKIQRLFCYTIANLDGGDRFHPTPLMLTKCVLFVIFCSIGRGGHCCTLG